VRLSSARVADIHSLGIICYSEPPSYILEMIHDGVLVVTYGSYNGDSVDYLSNFRYCEAFQGGFLGKNATCHVKLMEIIQSCMPIRLEILLLYLTGTTSANVLDLVQAQKGIQSINSKQ